jgi:hypothetical protein
LIAYLNCACGFGKDRVRHDAFSFDECGNDPNRNTSNTVLGWERENVSPITHYILSFLSFDGAAIQTDPGSIWADGGGSTTEFVLDADVGAAMAAAQRNNKKVMLSLGGETGSSRYLEWWRTHGSTAEARVGGMRAAIVAAIERFEQGNGGLKVDGIDIDIELGGGYVCLHPTPPAPD